MHPWCCVGRPSGKESACNPRAGKIPWRRAWQPTPVFLPGKSHGQRSLVGSSPWGRKESDCDSAVELAQCSVTITTSQLQNTFSALKENPIHLRQSLPALPRARPGPGPGNAVYALSLWMSPLEASHQGNQTAETHRARLTSHGALQGALSLAPALHHRREDAG